MMVAWSASFSESPNDFSIDSFSVFESHAAMNRHSDTVAQILSNFLMAEGVYGSVCTASIMPPFTESTVIVNRPLPLTTN